MFYENQSIVIVTGGANGQGYFGSGYVNDVYMLDLTTGVLKSLQSMKQRRSRHGIVRVNG